MKNITMVVLLAASLPVLADANLANSKNCMACHAVNNKVIGPAFKDVAAKYAKDPQAVNKLATKIQKGGSGVWGAMPMPANPHVTAAEAQILAKWVLSNQ